MSSFASRQFFKNCLKYGAAPFTATVAAYWVHQKYFKTFDTTTHNTSHFVRITERFSNQPDLTLKEDIGLFSGNSNPKLASEIAKILGVPLGNLLLKRFNDGEIQIKIEESIRGKDIYLVQGTSPPVNENLLELLLLISTFRRSGAKSINVIMPYYGYARQDRKTTPRTPISASDVSRLIESVGVDRIICVDLHCGQIQGFYSSKVQVDELEGNISALSYLLSDKDFSTDNLMVVSPDAGGVPRAKKFQDHVRSNTKSDPELALIIKHREVPGKVAKMYLVGNVKDKDCILVDDMVDTGGTLCEAVNQLKTNGARRVYAFATHALFSGPALQRIKESGLERMYVTDTLEPKANENEASGNKVVRISVAPLIAEAIRRIHSDDSLSELFRTK